MGLTTHALASAHFAFGIYYALAFVVFPDGVMAPSLRAIGWKKYLTFWNMCLQSVYFTICVLNDIAGSNEIAPRNPPLIRKIKDYMLCAVAFPVSMFVGLTFWGLYAIDRELVFPKALDPYFPTWLNHVMHTNIMIFIILEMVLSFRKYPTRGNGTKGLTAFMCVYLVWTFIIYFYSGAWVYPVLEVLNWGQRALFFIGLLLFVNSLYFVGEFLNTFIWVPGLLPQGAPTGILCAVLSPPILATCRAHLNLLMLRISTLPNKLCNCALCNFCLCPFSSNFLNIYIF